MQTSNKKPMCKTATKQSILTRMRIPLAPHLEATLKALTRLSATDKDQLKRLGLVKIFEGGSEETLSPLWTLKTSFYWEQRFAAGRETVIEHHYKPSVGSTVGVREYQKKEYFREYQRKYCMEPSFLRSVERPTGGSAGSSAFIEHRIEYILKTGANWAGPIRDFRIVVDKGKTTNFVSFCGDRVKKIGPTQFEIHATNYIPAENFYVLILEPIRDDDIQ